MGVQDPAPSAPVNGAYTQQYSQYPMQYPTTSHTAPVTPAHPVPPSGASRKRKAPGPSASKAPVIDLTQDSPPKKRRTKRTQATEDLASFEIDSAKPRRKSKKPKDDEKRMRRWRPHAPSSYLEIRDRALTQRMFVLNRERHTYDPQFPSETISLAGTTGNVYTINIDRVPTCDCPHARKGNQCKHIAYVLSRVLRVPSHLEYQLAFLTSELREIFEKAPPLPSQTAAEDDEKDGKRKPIEGECPICCLDFEPDSGEAIVYCKAACGNNIHADCFRQWAATKTGRGSVTCPFCRTPWQSDGGEVAAKDVAREGPKNGEGYVNVAAQLGLSGRRDYSSYHGHWVRRHAERGEISWDDDGVMSHDYY